MVTFLIRKIVKISTFQAITTFEYCSSNVALDLEAYIL